MLTSEIMLLYSLPCNQDFGFQVFFSFLSSVFCLQQFSFQGLQGILGYYSTKTATGEETFSYACWSFTNLTEGYKVSNYNRDDAGLYCNNHAIYTPQVRERWITTSTQKYNLIYNWWKHSSPHIRQECVTWINNVLVDKFCTRIDHDDTCCEDYL